jgi:hypothetical protein
VLRVSLDGNIIEEKRPNALGTFTATATGTLAPFVGQLLALRGSL